MSRFLLSLCLLLIFYYCHATAVTTTTPAATPATPLLNFPPPARNWPEPEPVNINHNAVTFLTTEHLRLISITSSVYAPPVIGRHVGNFARVMYEVTVPFTESWTSSSYLNEPPLHCIRIAREAQTRRNHIIALVYATYRVFEYLYVAHPDELLKTRLLLESHFDVNLERTSTAEYQTQPEDLGNHIAKIMIQAAKKDRSNSDGSSPTTRISEDTTGGLRRYIDTSNYIPYNPPHQPLRQPVCENIIKDMNKWSPLVTPSPTGAYRQIFLAPHFGQVKTFAVSPMDILPPPPQLLGTDAEPWNIDEMLEVIYFSGLLGDREKVITEVHADGFAFSRYLSLSPPGQWLYFSMVQATRKKLSLHDTILLLFVQGMAQYDASVSVRATKRFYDFIRPITRVQCSKWRDRTVRLWLGYYEGVGQTTASRFLPYMDQYFVTPPFAEYTSGHSQYSAAGSEVLKRFFGSDVFEWGVTVPEGESKFEPRIEAGQPGYRAGFTDVPNTGSETRGYTPGVKGVQLYWKTYSDYAHEDGLSRLHGGVHFRSGDLEGRKAGRLTAEFVWDKFVKLTGYEAPKLVKVVDHQVITVY